MSLSFPWKLAGVRGRQGRLKRDSIHIKGTISSNAIHYFKKIRFDKWVLLF